MLSALIISMALNAATKMQTELLDAPCAVEFDLAAMSLDDLETLPSAMKAFMPPSMKYRQVSRTIIRIDGKGAECGDYVSYYLRSPSSFDGLRIKKIAPAHSN